MPNTKSAERRMRSNARKASRNESTQSKLKTLEKTYATVLKTGKKDEATTALRNITSALDKAVKGGVVKKSTVDRKKSRLATALNKIAAAK